VVDVYDIDRDRAGQGASGWAARAPASAEELIRSIEIAVVATPGFARREHVEMAADAGMHVLCEKHEHFLDFIETGRAPLTGIDDAVDALRVCLAFNRSAAGGAVEKV